MEEEHEIDLRVFEPVAEVCAGNLWGVDTLVFICEAFGDDVQHHLTAHVEVVVVVEFDGAVVVEGDVVVEPGFGLVQDVGVGAAEAGLAAGIGCVAERVCL